MYWTNPYSQIPPRILVETTWRGGHRTGDPVSQRQQDYDRWWRQRALEILRAG